MTFYSRIAGTGSYLPDKILTNQELEGLVETSDEWIYSRTGIRQRHNRSRRPVRERSGIDGGAAARCRRQALPPPT